MLDNYNKQQEFNVNILKPVQNEILAIESEIRKIDLQELKEKEILEEKEAQEKFKHEKSDIEAKLYQALDKIYKKIPQEAHDVGMKSDVALKTYKPELVGVAKRLEWQIGELDSITEPYQLNSFKERLERQVD